MATITVEPQSAITLCKTNLESDYKNTFTFTNVSAQTSYFTGLSGNKSLSNYTYIRKDNKILCDFPYDQICTYNYLFYKNNGFTDAKTYYCFIDRLEYINENTTAIYFHTDVFQTWFFQITWNKCFVEREHVNDDTVGKHTVPEGLELGDYTGNGNELADTSLADYVYVMNVSQWTTDNPNNRPLAVNMGGIWMAGGCYIFTQMSELVNAVQVYANDGRLDAINDVWIAPKKLFGDRDFSHLQFEGMSTPETWSYEINMPTTIDGYTPKNNKLLTFPYQYLIMSNNNGSSNILHYELSSNENHKIEIFNSGVPVLGTSIKAIPSNYKNSTFNHAESLSCGKFPTCSWSEDSYTNWNTQNALNIAGQVVTEGVTIGVGLGMMSGGAVTKGLITTGSGIGALMQTIGAVYQHSLVPYSIAGNTNSGDILTARKRNTMHYYRMSIKNEYARIIDDFFSIYGYKVNSVKVPNITGRSQWNFVKTIDCNCDGNIPQEDLETIRKAMDTGVTFWHTPANIYNYSLSNNIV